MKKKALLFIGLLFYTCAPASGALPPDYTATYDVEKYSIRVGRSTITLEQADNRIHYSQEVKLVGFAALFKKDHVAEDSWLRKSKKNHFLLEKYQYIHTNGDRDRDVLIEGSWLLSDDDHLSGVLKGTVSGNPVSVQTRDATWDNFSFQLALMNDISAGKSGFSYNVISRGRLKKYTFSMIGPEPIKINAKRYETVKLERNDGRKKTLIWLAPELHYIPVLIETYKDNDLETKVIIDTAQFRDKGLTDE